MPYRGLCATRCAPLEIVVPRQEEISGAATVRVVFEIKRGLFILFRIETGLIRSCLGR